MGEGCGYICYTYLLFLHGGGGGFAHDVGPLLPIWAVACRRLAVKEWSHGVGSGVVVPVIG